MKISRGASIDRYYLVKLFGYAIFLHKIHHSDPGGLYHSHPWSGLSLICGRYTEHVRGKKPRLCRFWNWIPSTRHHRVVVTRPTWTLFIHLRRSNRWSVINEAGETTAEEPWRGDTGFKDYSNTPKGPHDSTPHTQTQ